MLDILADPVARIPGFGLETPLDFPFPVAAKTGTSRHFTDNWAVATTGRSPSRCGSGNFSGRPMEGVSGVTGAGPLLHRAVLATARRYDPGALPTPGRQRRRSSRDLPAVRPRRDRARSPGHRMVPPGLRATGALATGIAMAA